MRPSHLTSGEGPNRRLRRRAKGAELEVEGARLGRYGPRQVREDSGGGPGTLREGERCQGLGGTHIP